MAAARTDGANRVIYHAHTPGIIEMSFIVPLTDRDFTRRLWQMMTECIFVFPDGLGVLLWMLCGTNEIGQATAEKMKEFRLVVWALHGIYGTGRSLDEAFGLIETAEKAAEIYIKTAHLPHLNTITDEQLRVTAEFFGAKIREGWA